MAAALRERLAGLRASIAEALAGGRSEPASAVCLFDRHGWVVWRANGDSHACRVELPPRWWEEGRLEEAASSLAAAVEGVPGPVVLCVPRRIAIVRYVTLPSRDPKELASMVGYEVGRLLPFPLEEAVWGFCPVGEVTETGSGESGTRVMVVAVRRGELDRYLNLLGAAGLEPVQVRLSTFAVASAVDERDGTGVGLVYLTEDCTEITVLRERGVVFSRSAPVGLAGMTQEEREALVQGRPDAASLWLGRFADELERTLVAYSVRERGASLSAILLGGEGAGLDLVAERLALATGLPVRSIGLEAEGGPGSLVGWGALSERFGVDLLPGDVRSRRRARLLKLRLSLAGGALGGLLAVALLVLAVGFAAARAKESSLQRRIEELTRGSEGAYLGEIASLKGFLGRGGSPLEVLRVVSEAAVGLDDIQLTRLEYFVNKPTPVLMEGQAKERESVTSFVSRLQEAGVFAQVESPRLKTIGSVLEFELGCTFSAEAER